MHKSFSQRRSLRLLCVVLLLATTGAAEHLHHAHP
jgi:hypothetical protein